MKIPKEIADKVRCIEELRRQLAALEKDVRDFLVQTTDAERCAVISHFRIVDKPAGEEQFDGEWCFQLGPDPRNLFFGHYYHELEDGGGYLEYYFELQSYIKCRNEHFISNDFANTIGGK